MAERNLRKASLSRMAGVSRAAVTKWFKNPSPQGWVNVESRTLYSLASGLKVAPEVFLRQVPSFDHLAPRFLWDGLFPTMELFLVAAGRGDPPALARLVQVLGFHDASQIVGKRILSLFDHYKKFIKPARRRQLEILCPLYASKS